MGGFSEIAAGSTLMHDLHTQGYTLIKCDARLVTPVLEGLRSFVIRRQQLHDWDAWRWCIPGEMEDDVGLVRPRAGKDEKYFLHANQYLIQQLTGRIGQPDREFLFQLVRLTHYMTMLEVRLVAELSQYFGREVLMVYLANCGQVVPYSTSTLRGLWYPATPTQTGARTHLDRSLLTIHFGDIGGSLVALSGPADQVGKVVVIPHGYAAVFCGVKILWVTHGRMQPLWHKSVVEPHTDRLALVRFVHVPIKDYWVTDAGQAYDDFYRIFHPMIRDGSYRLFD